MPPAPRESLPPRFPALVVIALAAACARPIVPVQLETVPFASELPPIAGAIEVCIPKRLRARHWNVDEHPYRVELGKRAAIQFERMAKAAFRDVVVDYSGECGSLTNRPWLEAEIVSANRDWDGVEGIVDPEPVDTALTMSFALYADDGVRIWNERFEARHRAPGFVGTPRMRSQRGSRDFGIALGKALQMGYAALLTSPEVRAFFADDGLDRAAAESGGGRSLALSPIPGAGTDARSKRWRRVALRA